MRVANLTSGALFFANAMRALSQWLFVWLTTQLGGLETVGQYSLALAIVTPVFIVGDLSLRNVYVTLQRSIPFRTYLFVRLSFGSLAVVALVVVGLLGVVAPELLTVIGLIKFTDSILDLCYGSLQKRGRNLSIAWTSTLNSVVTMMLGALLYLVTGDLVIALTGSLLGSLVTTAIVFIPVVRSESSTATRQLALWTEIGAITRAGVPSGLAFASVSLLTYSPIYLLGIARDEEQVGLFAVLSYFPILANLVFGSIQQATLHDYVNALRAGGDKSLGRVAVRKAVPLTLLGVAAALGTIGLGIPVLRFVYGPDFVVTFPELLPVGLSLVFLPGVFAAGPVLLSKNLYVLQLLIGVISLTVTLIIGICTLEIFTLATAGWLLVAGTMSRSILGIAAAYFSLRRPR